MNQFTVIIRHETGAIGSFTANGETSEDAQKKLKNALGKGWTAVAAFMVNPKLPARGPESYREG